MNAKNKQIKKKRVAWGITGAGDKIAEFMEVMKEIQQKYKDIVEIHVFLSKAAEIVLKYYRLEEELRQNFAKVTVELNSNTPFLAAWMQMHKYEFLLVAPSTSNTVAKIANGITFLFFFILTPGSPCGPTPRPAMAPEPATLAGASSPMCLKYSI